MTRRVARGALTAGVAAVVLPLVVSGVAAAAPALGEATATVEVDEQGAAQVELTYVIDGGDGPDDTTSLSFSALDFGGDAGPVDDLEVTSADGEQLESSVETADLKTTVTVTLDEPLAAGAETTLTLRYTAPDAGVVDGDRMTADVPVLVFDLPAATTAPGVFAATVRLAPGYDYVEGFPANPDRVSASDGRTEVAYELPAAPSLLRSVATTADTPLLTLGGWVNLALFLTLLAGGAALALSFTRGRARAAAERDDAAPATEPAGRRH